MSNLKRILEEPRKELKRTRRRVVPITFKTDERASREINRLVEDFEVSKSHIVHALVRDGLVKARRDGLSEKRKKTHPVPLSNDWKTELDELI